MNPSIEQLITARYRKTIWSPFLSAVKRWGMAMPGDRIAVCLSGGKDSLLLAACMSILKKYSSVPFELVYLSMDPGYSPQNRAKVQEAAGSLGLQVEMFETDIYSIVDGVKKSPCHVCAAMRRGYLYKEAKLRGCNRIALGHHRDDAAETILLGLIYGGQFQAMMPRLKSENYDNMQLIRPLYLVREQAVKNWLAATGIQAITCACRVTKKEDGGKRASVKRLIAGLEKEQPNLVDNLVSASQRVKLSTLLSYIQEEGAREQSVMDDLIYGERQGLVDTLF